LGAGGIVTGSTEETVYDGEVWVGWGGIGCVGRGIWVGRFVDLRRIYWWIHLYYFLGINLY
jgi:hypothetical protein